MKDTDAYKKLAQAAGNRNYQLSAITSAWWDNKTRYVAYIEIAPHGAHGGIGNKACFTAMEAVDACITEFRKIKEELRNEQQKEAHNSRTEDNSPK